MNGYDAAIDGDPAEPNREGGFARLPFRPLQPDDEKYALDQVFGVRRIGDHPEGQ